MINNSKDDDNTGGGKTFVEKTKFGILRSMNNIFRISRKINSTVCFYCIKKESHLSRRRRVF